MTGPMTGKTIRHLTRADYTEMPWANGRGTTLELARADGPDGLLWRLSLATVTENGPFSQLPGIDRTLTVTDGPGFLLLGQGTSLAATPGTPIRFRGETPLWASGVTAPSRDFNVMTARAHLSHHVESARPGPLPARSFLLALGDNTATLNSQTYHLSPYDLLILPEPATLTTTGALLRITLV